MQSLFIFSLFYFAFSLIARTEQTERRRVRATVC